MNLIISFGSVSQSDGGMLEKECSPYDLALTYDMHCYDCLRKIEVAWRACRSLIE